MKLATISAAILVFLLSTIAITALAVSGTQPAHADPDCNEPPTNLSAALNGENSAVTLTLGGSNGLHPGHLRGVPEGPGPG